MQPEAASSKTVEMATSLSVTLGVGNGKLVCLRLRAGGEWLGWCGEGRAGGSESLRVLSAHQEVRSIRAPVRNPPWGPPGGVVAWENRKASGRS